MWLLFTNQSAQFQFESQLEWNWKAEKNENKQKRDVVGIHRKGRAYSARHRTRVVSVFSSKVTFQTERRNVDENLKTEGNGDSQNGRVQNRLIIFLRVAVIWNGNDHWNENWSQCSIQEMFSFETTTTTTSETILMTFLFSCKNLSHRRLLFVC